MPLARVGPGGVRQIEGLDRHSNLIIIDSVEVRRAVKVILEQENQRAAENDTGEQAVPYRLLTLEGIMEPESPSGTPAPTW